MKGGSPSVILGCFQGDKGVGEVMGEGVVAGALRIPPPDLLRPWLVRGGAGGGKMHHSKSGVVPAGSRLF